MSKRITDVVIAGLLTTSFLTTACWSEPAANNGKWETISSDAPKNASQANNRNTRSAGNSNMEKEVKSGGFEANLPSGFVQPSDDVGRRLLREYGALFMARNGATPPKTIIFKSEAEVSAFQSSITKASETVGGRSIELQSAAMEALKAAAADAGKQGSTITPRGDDAARRTYSGTVELWASRVDPGLTHWVGKGKITSADAQRIRSLTPFEQVPEIFKLESQGIFFAKDLSKSIIYSVAPPGTSQHLSMLALDVSEHDNAAVRAILAKHGWFQTVVSDLPHFTYLGVAENELPGLGLKKTSDAGRTYWVPAI